MSSASQETQTTLDAQAAALVATPSTEIDLDALAAEAVENLVADPPKPAAPPAAPPPTAAEPAPESAAMQSMDDLAAAVQKLVEDAAPKPPEPPLPSDTKIETLDAHIAGLADDLIAGEFADEQNTIKGQVGAPPVPPEAPAPAPTPAPQPPPPEPAPAVAPVVTAPSAPSPAAPPPVARHKPAKAAPPAPAPETPAKTRKLAAALRPLSTLILSTLAAPLRNRPKPLRDLIGWVAIITIFNATCLWGYLLFFRSSTPTIVVAKAAEDSSHEKPAEKDAHGAPSKDAHGATKPKEKKTAAKKPVKKDAKAQAAHGGGH